MSLVYYFFSEHGVGLHIRLFRKLTGDTRQ